MARCLGGDDASPAAPAGCRPAPAARPAQSSTFCAAGADTISSARFCRPSTYAYARPLHSGTDCASAAPLRLPSPKVGLRISQEMTGRVNVMTAEKQV